MVYTQRTSTNYLKIYRNSLKFLTVTYSFPLSQVKVTEKPVFSGGQGHRMTSVECEAMSSDNNLKVLKTFGQVQCIRRTLTGTNLINVDFQSFTNFSTEEGWTSRSTICTQSWSDLQRISTQLFHNRHHPLGKRVMLNNLNSMSYHTVNTSGTGIKISFYGSVCGNCFYIPVFLSYKL